jgi:hypothetical protein
MQLTHCFTLDGVPLTVTYDGTPYVPATMYRANGDPGDPAEGGEVELLAVKIGDTEIDDFAAILADRFLDEIEDRCAEFLTEDLQGMRDDAAISRAEARAEARYAHH